MPLTIVRHAQSTGNLFRIYTGQQDYALTEEGARQAQLAGAALSGQAFDLVITSDLQRAIHTANLILCANSRKRPTEWIRTRRLAERYEGLVEGVPRAMAEIQYGPETARAWEHDVNMPMPGNGETISQVYDRAASAYEQLIRPELDRGRSILLVSHSWVIRALVCYRSGRTAHDIPNMSIWNCGIIDDANGSSDMIYHAGPATA